MGCGTEDPSSKPHPSHASPPEVKVMYLFAGKRRQSDVASFLQQAHDAGRIKLTLKEFDIEISPEHDLTNLSIWEDIWNTLKEGGWMLIVFPSVQHLFTGKVSFSGLAGSKTLEEHQLATWFSVAGSASQSSCGRGQHVC